MWWVRNEIDMTLSSLKKFIIQQTVSVSAFNSSPCVSPKQKRKKLRSADALSQVAATTQGTLCFTNCDRLPERWEYLTGCGNFSFKISQTKFERVDYTSK